MIAQYDFATPAYDEAVRLRDAVLRRPLGLSIADDDLTQEFKQVHLGVWQQGRLVATASLVPNGTSLKMRQVAVAEEARGQGVGKALTKACEAYAQRTGVARLYCHARLTAKPFYIQCGWQPVGEQFEEVGIPHVVCEASLSASKPQTKS